MVCQSRNKQHLKQTTGPELEPEQKAMFIPEPKPKLESNIWNKMIPPEVKKGNRTWWTTRSRFELELRCGPMYKAEVEPTGVPINGSICEELKQLSSDKPFTLIWKPISKSKHEPNDEQAGELRLASMYNSM